MTELDAGGVSLFLPTGNYDKNRGPNPGFGNFYTLRPGIALSYAPARVQADRIIDALRAAGVPMIDVASEQPDLEDVFLSLTGR